MTFDEDLRRAFDALGDRLRAEVQRQVETAFSEVHAAVPAPQPVEPLAAASTVRLNDILPAIRAMDEARSLTDILDVLATAAAAHARGAAILLRRSNGVATWRAIGVDASLDAEGATRLPLTIVGEAIGELYAEDGAVEALELLARHASRCLESMTAFKTARALVRQAEPPNHEQISDEDTSARRYAKLLVSEIKLYHETDVIAGRRERDLASRLGGEIARARVLYDQRVPPHVRQRADHFRDELVRTLADGDSSLLEFHA